jgi:MoaA/NifB/PqqE/SkfB family radical SAM enzyme
MRVSTAAESRDENVAGFDGSLRGLFRDAVRIAWHDPERLMNFAKTAARQREAAARRRWWEAQGVHVPPAMTVSVTRSCNLECGGCFVHAQGRPADGQMSDAELRSVFAQARHLGVSIIALAGGEPLSRPELLDMAADFPEIQFMLITNGSLIGGPVLDRLESLRNVIPVLSLEGFARETGGWPGDGVYGQAILAMERMRERRIFFGTSVMITRRNFALVTSRMFARDLVERGCRLFFYVDYVPIEPGTEHLVPSPSQRNCEALTMAILRREFPAQFVASSAMEQSFGSCLAA